jgi:phage gpG-like protein
MLRPALELIAEDMMRRVNTVFQSEGRQSGTGQFRGRWAPLSPITIRKKAKAGHDLRILHERLPLRTSLTQKGAPNQVLRFSRNALEFGSAEKYADTHQHGRGYIPARPFITFGPVDEERWGGIIAMYIVDPLKNRVR